MSDPLFFNPELSFEKLSAEVKLPEDPNKWPDEILSELFKQVPYLSDFDVHIVMENVDGERGYGMGHAEVSSKTEAPMGSPADQLASAGVRKARIPLIVKGGKLSPLDVVVTDASDMLPLTESRLRQAMFRPQMFDVTSKTPGDQSMIGQLYPPYRQNYGFGGGGVAVSAGMGGKTASASFESWLMEGAKEGGKPSKLPEADSTRTVAVPSGFKLASGETMLTVALSQARPQQFVEFADALDQATKQAFVNNVASYEALDAIEAARTASGIRFDKVAHGADSTVTQVTRRSDGAYAVKTANRSAWAPSVEVIDRGELVRRYGVKTALAVDTAGSATEAVTPDAQEVPADVDLGPISSPGTYKVKSVADGNFLVGIVVPNLLDTDGSALPISLFVGNPVEGTDNIQAACQSDIVGSPEGAYAPPQTLPAAQASGRGVFVAPSGVAPQMTLPITISGTIQQEDGPVSVAQTFDGRPVHVQVQPYVSSVVGIDDTMLVPESWGWLPLDAAAEVVLAETAGPQKEASAKTCTLHAAGRDCFALRGLPEKIASEFLTQDDVVFTLAGMGVPPAETLRKVSAAMRPPYAVEVATPCCITPLEDVRSKVASRVSLQAGPRVCLWKEAAVLPDPTAVDAVLSLGFLNPENMSSFLGGLPQLEIAQKRLCELLVASRLGLREVPEGAVERAVRALEDVIAGLHVLAFSS